MKQISNWVFGSFFRTIGRLLVFILLGFIIAHFIDFGSLKDSFSITDLFFDKVKADTQISAYWESYYTNSNKTTEYNYSNNYAIGEITNSYASVNIIDFWLSRNIVKNANENYVMFPVMILGENYGTATTTLNEYVCSYQSYVQNGTTYYYPQSCGYQVNSASGSGTVTIPVNINLNFVVKLRAPNQNDAFCEMVGSYAKCYLQENTTYQYIRIEYNQSGSNVGNNIRFGINRGISTYKSDQASITESIQNQTQQQQQQHQETQNYLEDSNTTQAESEATSFFDDFDAPDIGGLGAIITAPLNTIRSLLNSSCSNLVLPLPFINEDLTLPCMNSIYTEHFGAFFTIYQTIILALIAYRCIRSIFFDIHGFTNPNDDRIEVMDL